MTAPPKPPILGVHPENIPGALTDIPQWVCWRLEWVPPNNGKAGRWTKKPYQVPAEGPEEEDNPKTKPAKLEPLVLASSIDPATWTAFGKALEFSQVDNRVDGTGFVFTEEAGIIGVDLDKCVAEDGTIAEWALEVVRRFNSFTELSPSGTGLHIYTRGQIPITGRKKGPVEIYRQGRFFTTTGRLLSEVAR
jgi:primase-polymerase (primpol)-like protein